MTDQEIADSLSEAQRAAIVAAKIPPPTNILPNYRMVDLPNCGMTATEADKLQSLGLVSLPIRIGARTGTASYSGEIHPIGLRVRAILEKSNG